MEVKVGGEIPEDAAKDIANDIQSPELSVYMSPERTLKKNWKPTPKDYDLVYKLCMIGMGTTKICWLLNVQPDTFKQVLKRDETLQLMVEKGREMGVYAVTKTVFDMIVKEKNDKLAMFFLKCKAGWKEEGEQPIVFNQLNITPENYDEIRQKAKRYSERLNAKEPYIDLTSSQTDGPK